jgi:Rap1a immunity proteins
MTQRIDLWIDVAVYIGGIMLLIAIAGAALVATTPAAAEPLSGRAWATDCGSNIASVQLMCHVYAKGVADGVTTTGGACVPASAKTEELVSVGRAFINRAPDHLQHTAAMMLFAAFRLAPWPLARLAEDEEPGLRGGATRSRGRLLSDSRRGLSVRPGRC